MRFRFVLAAVLCWLLAGSVMTQSAQAAYPEESLASLAGPMIASVAMANGVSWSQSISTVNWLPRPISITTNNVTNPLALTNYAYDDAGNVKSVGGDTFVYDKVGRLVSGSAEGGTKTQTQTYDSFGNIKTIGGVAQSPNAATNRLAGATYDAGGTATYFAGDYFDIDPLGMVQAVHDLNYTNKYWAFVYTADDERIWKYDMGPANTSWWRLRNIDNRVVSEFVNVGATWNAVNNYVYREGILLGRQYASGATRTNTYFAVDHLGTPRRIFDAARNVIAAPAYFAFGQETTSTSRNEDLRFTGHERDYGIGGVAPKDTLDYMHARHYSPNAGRFLSVDPKGSSAKPALPQTWNRYAYALNNPVKYIDPDGEETQLVVGHHTYGNPAGHVALAINGRVYSFGTEYTQRGGNKDWGGSLATYLGAQGTRRETSLLTLNVTSQQEAQLQQFLEANNPNAPGAPLYNELANSCVTVVRVGLQQTNILPRTTDNGLGGSTAVTPLTPGGLAQEVTQAGLVTQSQKTGTEKVTWLESLWNFVRGER